MTQNETIWLLVGIVQFGVMGFVSYWTRRVQRLEDDIAKTWSQRSETMLEYQGRITRLEAQFAAIMDMLGRIEKRLDRNEEE